MSQASEVKLLYFRIAGGQDSSKRATGYFQMLLFSLLIFSLLKPLSKLFTLKSFVLIPAIATKLPLKLEGRRALITPQSTPHKAMGPPSWRGKPKFTPHYPSHQPIPFLFIKNLGKNQNNHHLLKKCRAIKVYVLYMYYIIYPNLGPNFSEYTAHNFD